MSIEMDKPELVTPRTLKGFQDYLPSASIARQKVLAAITPVYESFGFTPIDTPILEHLTTLVGAGGDETNKLLFRLESPEKELVAMRFDLTVPFARILAQYGETLKLPFRRYHIGPVFRGDKPGPGRFRQFTQCDIDAAGSSSLYVDAEVVAVICRAFRALGLSPDQAQNNAFLIKINNRKVVDAFLSNAGISTESGNTLTSVLRVVDKLDKVGLDAIRLELAGGRYDESGDFIKGVGLAPAQIDSICDFIGIREGTRLAVVEALAKRLGDGEEAIAALNEMRQLAEGLESLGISEEEAIFDPSLARGLDYYTGPVFEAVLPHAPQFGSVMGGGRYNQLVARFSEDNIPATGASIGIDRLVDALIYLGELSQESATSQAILISLAGVPPAKMLRLATTLRDAGIPSEVFNCDGKTSMRDQLSYANAKNIPVAVILGEDEIQSGEVTIKDLRAGKQVADIQDRAEYVKKSKSSQVRVPEGEMVAVVSGLL